MLLNERRLYQTDRSIGYKVFSWISCMWLCFSCPIFPQALSSVLKVCVCGESRIPKGCFLPSGKIACLWRLSKCCCRKMNCPNSHLLIPLCHQFFMMVGPQKILHEFLKHVILALLTLRNLGGIFYSCLPLSGPRFLSPGFLLLCLLYSLPDFKEVGGRIFKYPQDK